MFKRILGGIALFLLMSGLAIAKPLSLNEITEGICRVNSGAFGSGTCISEDINNYYILTNSHVVGNKSTVSVEFFRKGIKSKPISGNVIWNTQRPNTDTDLALIAITKNKFGDSKLLPRIIPIAPKGYSVENNQYISAVGCPSGRWAEGWEGRIKQGSGSRILFVPAPIGGQSGSGITSNILGKDGELYTRVVAVLTWRIGENISAIGGAVPISNLYRALTGETSYSQPTPNNWKMVATNYAYCSDGKYYPINSRGSVVTPLGVRVLEWNVDPTIGRRWRGNPVPPPPTPPRNPSPSPSPRVPPINSPWPGEKPEPKVPTPEPKVPTPEPKVPQPDKIGTLEEELKRLKEAKENLEIQVARVEQAKNNEIAEIEKELKESQEKAEKAKAEAEAAKKEAAKNNGIFAKIGGWIQGHPWLSGICLAGLFLVLKSLWTRVIRPRVVASVDSLQTALENLIRKTMGDEAAVDARAIMEDMESAILELVDQYLAQKREATKILNRKSNLLKSKILKGNEPPQHMLKSGELTGAAAVAEAEAIVAGLKPDAKELVEKMSKIMEEKKSE